MSPFSLNLVSVFLNVVVLACCLGILVLVLSTAAPADATDCDDTAELPKPVFAPFRLDGSVRAVHTDLGKIVVMAGGSKDYVVSVPMKFRFEQRGTETTMGWGDLFSRHIASDALPVTVFHDSPAVPRRYSLDVTATRVIVGETDWATSPK